MLSSMQGITPAEPVPEEASEAPEDLPWEEQE